MSYVNKELALKIGHNRLHSETHPRVLLGGCKLSYGAIIAIDNTTL